MGRVVAKGVSGGLKKEPRWVKALYLVGALSLGFILMATWSEDPELVISNGFIFAAGAIAIVCGIVMAVRSFGEFLNSFKHK